MSIKFLVYREIYSLLHLISPFLLCSPSSSLRLLSSLLSLSLSLSILSLTAAGQPPHVTTLSRLPTTLTFPSQPLQPPRDVDFSLRPSLLASHISILRSPSSSTSFVAYPSLSTFSSRFTISNYLNLFFVFFRFLFSYSFSLVLFVNCKLI